jgi:hypothetical protein
VENSADGASPAPTASLAPARIEPIAAEELRAELLELRALLDF